MNVVHNLIVFDKKYAKQIFETCCPYGGFDFELLVPVPDKYQPVPGMFDENCEENDEKDDWFLDNWGTKDYASESEIVETDDQAAIIFETWYREPDGIITAFANKFKIPFTFWYVYEHENWCGMQRWLKGKITEELTQDDGEYTVLDTYLEIQHFRNKAKTQGDTK